MRPPRLSIRGLMLSVVGIAFGLVALRFSISSMASAVVLSPSISTACLDGPRSPFFPNNSTWTIQ